MARDSKNGNGTLQTMSVDALIEHLEQSVHDTVTILRDRCLDREQVIVLLNDRLERLKAKGGQGRISPKWAG